MRNIPMNRTEAEWLVDLLEKCNPEIDGLWRYEMASEIRVIFGMITREQELANRVAKKEA